MRNQWARGVVLGLVLAFPVLMSATAGSITTVAPVLAVETVLVGGLVFASRERRRLLVEMDAARGKAAQIGTFSPAMRSGAKAPARGSLLAYLRR